MADSVLTGELRAATIQAEASLIGAVLIGCSDGAAEVLDYLRAHISPSDMYDCQYRSPDNRHARIMTGLLGAERGDQISVAQWLHDHQMLYAGDVAYLSQCIAECPTWLEYDAFAEVVLRYARERRGERPAPVIGVTEI